MATAIQLMAGLLIPAQLITIIVGTASVEQDIALLCDYLHQATTHTQHHGRRPGRAITCPAKPHHQRSGLPTTNSIASGTPFGPQIHIDGDRATRTRPLDVFIGNGE